MRRDSANEGAVYVTEARNCEAVIEVKLKVVPKISRMLFKPLTRIQSG